MPRIHDRYLECVVYIYSSEEAATAGRSEGGTGFIVCMFEETDVPALPKIPYGYVVTNCHVAFGCDTPVIRNNKSEGGFELIPTRQSDWTPHPDYADIAVYPLGLVVPSMHKGMPTAVFTNEFLTRERVEELDIGPGDEVFFVGRFISHEGRQANLPTVRFGNVSMMPIEPIRNRRSGVDQESFLVEARSISGYSGSPVFVHIPPLALRPSKSAIEGTSYGPFLLGVDWGHLGGKDLVRTSAGQPEESGLYIQQNAAMTTVVPAWCLQELIDTDYLKQARRKAVEKWAAATPKGPETDSASD